MVFIVLLDFHRFSLIFKENGASVGQPSAPWRWVLNDEKIVFRVGRPPKTGPMSRSLPRPSAAIGGLWVGVKRRYGSPPSNSPRLSICIYKVEVVGVVGCSHTPEESADSLAFESN